MAAPYSKDLWEKALAVLARRERPSRMARLLGISRTTLNPWRH